MSFIWFVPPLVSSFPSPRLRVNDACKACQRHPPRRPASGRPPLGPSLPLLNSQLKPSFKQGPLIILPAPQTGIRLSPFGGFLSAQDSDPVGSISYLLEQLNK